MSANITCNQLALHNDNDMEQILFLTLIFLFINFTVSQYNTGGTTKNYDSDRSQYASTYSGGNSDMGKKYSQTTVYQQPYGGKTAAITKEVIQSPNGTTKIITTQQQQQQPAYGSSYGNFERVG